MYYSILPKISVLVIACWINATNGLDFIDENFQPRIVGGTAAGAKEYPYVASLKRNGRHVCGGSLYSSRILVTAAHCVVYSTIGSLSVHVKGNTQTTVGTEVFKVLEIRVHPTYSASTFRNDIALVVLSGESSINPVDLWSFGKGNGKTGTAVGWGATVEGGSVSKKLMKVNVPIISNTKCENAYPTGVFSGMVCAGPDEGGKDSCQGDSGGPLFVVNGDKPYLFGIVSWGYGCAYEGYYGVYTRVSEYLDFINENSEVTPLSTQDATEKVGNGYCRDSNFAPGSFIHRCGTGRLPPCDESTCESYCQDDKACLGFEHWNNRGDDTGTCSILYSEPLTTKVVSGIQCVKMSSRPSDCEFLPLTPGYCRDANNRKPFGEYVCGIRDLPKCAFEDCKKLCRDSPGCTAVEIGKSRREGRCKLMYGEVSHTRFSKSALCYQMTEC